MGSKNKKTLRQKQKKKKVIDISKRIADKQLKNISKSPEYYLSEKINKLLGEKYLDNEKLIFDSDFVEIDIEDLEKTTSQNYQYLTNEIKDSSTGVFIKIAHNFSRRMVSLLITFSEAKMKADRDFEKANSDFEKFSDKYQLKAGKNINKIEEELYKLKVYINFAHKFRTQIFASLYINLFSKFERNLQILIEFFYEENPEALNDSDLSALGHHPKSKKGGKFLSLGDLKKFRTITEVEESIKDIIIGEETRTKSLTLKWIKKEIDFELDDYDRKWLDFIYDLRNCIAHQDGFVTKEVLKSHKLLKDNDGPTEITKADFEEGDRIEIDDAIFKKTYDCLCIIGHKIILAFWMKLSKSKGILTLSTGIYQTYVIDKMYEIAVQLLRNLLSKEKDFASRNPDTFRIVDEKLRAVLYYCHSLKKLGKIDECINEINKIDWDNVPEGLLDSYSIPKAAILGDIDEVVRYMHKLPLGKEYYYLDYVSIFIGDINANSKFKNAFKEKYSTEYDKSIYYKYPFEWENNE